MTSETTLKIHHSTFPTPAKTKMGHLSIIIYLNHGAQIRNLNTLELECSVLNNVFVVNTDELTAWVGLL